MRILLAVTMLALSGVMGEVTAAPGPPEVVDASDDWPVAAADIVSVDFAAGSGTKGRRVVVVTMSLRGPANGSEPTTYTVAFATPNCERARLVVEQAGSAPGIRDHGYVDLSGCEDRDARVRDARGADVLWSIVGNRVVWRLQVGDVVAAGQALSSLEAAARIGGGVSVSGADLDAASPIGDDARSDKTYTVARQ